MILTNETVLIGVVIWIVSAVGSYLIAAQRGDPSPAMWAVVGFLLGPVGLLATGVFAAPRKTD